MGGVMIHQCMEVEMGAFVGLDLPYEMHQAPGGYAIQTSFMSGVQTFLE